MIVRAESCAPPLFYYAYGLTLGSDLPLPELFTSPRTVHHTRPDILVTVGSRHGPHPSPITPFLTRRSASGGVWMQHARTEDGYLLRFPDYADFYVAADGRTVAIQASEGTSEDTLRHFLLDQVLPPVLTLHGQQAIHATAVLTQAGVCAFTGPAGTGKSTLAASFQFAGIPLISDDCLILEPQPDRVVARPAYPGLRLLDDALEALCAADCTTLPVAQYTSKRRPVLEPSGPGFPAGQYPLARIYCLSREDCGDEGAAARERIEPVSQQEAFLELLRSTFTLDSEDRGVMLRQFRWLDQVASLVLVRRLHVPSRFEALASVRDSILADLGSP
ncbi:MAG: hypothetical protein EPO61_13840 [Nitrospirae bacterium]|nr:MAG: hypothetical protein EPO61_13840 [Nitrospirota bacterium]